MNTKVINNTQVRSIPVMPTIDRSNRVLTKHFTNSALYLPINEYSLLGWLIYQSGADNGIKYSTLLLLRYSQSVKAANKVYGGKNEIVTSVQRVRVILKRLIERGYILKCGGEMIINPMLTYRADYLTKKQYYIICQAYQDLTLGDVEVFIDRYQTIINKKAYGNRNNQPGGEK